MTPLRLLPSATSGLGIPRHMRMAAHFFAEFDRLTEAQQDASGQGAVSEAAAIELRSLIRGPEEGGAAAGAGSEGFGGGAGLRGGRTREC